MLKEKAGNSIELPSRANRKYLEHQSCQIVGDVRQTLQTSGLQKSSFSLIESLWNHLNDVIHHLDQLPEPAFREMMEVIAGVRESRNELRLALFLFDVEEINPLHRFVMRNRALVRGKQILQKTLLVWPVEPSC
jgi:hypothetical protein